MRLSADQIRQAILHPDWEVRDMALGYFRESFSTDRAVMPLLIEAVERYGWAEACSPYTICRPLEQSETTVQWLIEQLQQPCPDLDREPLWICWTRFLSWLLNGASAVLLLPFERAFEGLAGLDPECLESIHKRVAASGMDPEAGWRELERFCEQSAADYELIDYADEDFHRFEEVILRGGERFAERVLEFLSEPSSEITDEDPRYWMQGAATMLAGQLRLVAAVPHLVTRLEEDIEGDGHWYCFRCADALIRIGTDDVVRAVAERIPGASWDFRSVSSRIFEAIHSEFAVQSGMELLAAETDDTLRAYLADGLLFQFDSQTLEPVRRLILRGQCDELEEQLIRRLVAVSTLLSVPVPELEPWRERARESTASHRQELEERLTEDGRLPDDWDNESEMDELQAVYGLLDDFDEVLDDDLAELEGLGDDFDGRLDSLGDDPEEAVRPIVHGDPKVGRNDLCPCGSGKKFKKCCMNRQKNPPRIDW